MRQYLLFNYLITPMNQALVTYDVAFNQLPERYGITQGTLSHRIKRLGLKTVKRGRKTYLTVTQLAKLDELAKFFKENPNSDIDDFLRINESIAQSFIDERSINYQSTEESLLNKSLNNSPMIDNLSLTKAAFHLFQEKLTEFIEERFDSIDEQLSEIKETTSDIREGIDDCIDELSNDYLMDSQSTSDRLIDRQSLDAEKIKQLENQVSLLQEQVRELSAEEEKYRYFVEYWSQTLPNNLTEYDIRSLDGFGWIRTKKSREQLKNELPRR